MGNETHLIYEIKRELDWAAEEVERTDKEVMQLEQKFNTSIETADEEDRKRLFAEKQHLIERIGLHDAFSLQKRAAWRFYMICKVYEIASDKKSANDIRDQLSKFMYRSMDGEAQNADQKDKLLELAEALMTYFNDGHSDEADEAIREAWQNIEQTLRELGRD